MPVLPLTDLDLVYLLHNAARLSDQVLDRLARGGLVRLSPGRLRLQLLPLPRQRLRLVGEHFHLVEAKRTDAFWFWFGKGGA